MYFDFIVFLKEATHEVCVRSLLSEFQALAPQSARWNWACDILHGGRASTVSPPLVFTLLPSLEKVGAHGRQHAIQYLIHNDTNLEKFDIKKYNLFCSLKNGDVWSLYDL